MNDKSSDKLSHDALIDRVGFLMDRRRYDQARTELREGLGRFPDSPSLIYFSAFIDWIDDRLEPAHESVQQLLRLAPEHYGGRVLLGQLLAERKDLGGAEEVWIALIKNNPEDPELYAHYGELMLNVLDIDKAQRLAQEGLRYDPESEHCLYVAAMARLVDGQGIGDNEDLATLIARHPEHLRAGTTLVIALQERGRRREALRVSQELLRAQPDNPQLLENVKILKAATHWSMLPLYPIHRWGWPAVFALWAIFALGLPRIAPGLPPGIVLGITIFWVVYVIYSWVWPPLLRKRI